MTRIALVLAALGVAAPAALADAPRVVTDIPPVHSLVARVMEGVGAAPDLILPPGGSPHGHAMRPSEAAALAGADVLVWMGPALTPWLERAVGSLAPDARSLPLLEAESTLLLGFRQGAAFEPHTHDDGQHKAARDAAQEPGQGAETEPRDHDRGGKHDETRAAAGEEAHGREAVDSHAWLDPRNAGLWLGAIAEALAEADPENAAAYRANADAARAELDALTAELQGELAPLRGKPFVVFHDAYHYFENRFGIEAAGALSLSDASPPGPARVAEIRDLIARTGAACVFAEPQFPADLIATVIEGTSARAATLDPVGTTLEPGPDLYPRLLRNLAADLRACLNPAD